MLTFLRLLLTAVAIAAAAAPVHAAGPVLVSGSGTPLSWAPGAIPFNPDQGPLGARNNAQAVADVDADFGVWAAVPIASIGFANAGALPVDVTVANYTSFIGVCGDSVNPVVFDSDGSIIEDIFGVGASNTVIVTAGPDCQSFGTARITEGSAILNGKWIDGVSSASNPELPLTAFGAAVIHELGHYVNLGNSQINLAEATDNSTANDAAVATMYPFLIGHCDNAVTRKCSANADCSGTGQCVNPQGTLELDDRVSLATLYPGASFSASFGRITGSILLPNREGAVQGAYVIARAVGDPRLTAVGAASGARFFPDTPGGPPPPGLRALYELSGLPPGSYTVEIEAIDPSFTEEQSVGPLDPPVALPGPAEFWNGTNESNANPPDSPGSAVAITVQAGQSVGGIDIVSNGTITGPANDRCAAPTVISALPFSTTIGTTAATIGIYDPFQTCTAGGPNQNSNSVWYTFMPSASGTMTATTAGSTYDTVLTAYAGGCGAFTQVACSDDSGGTFQSQISFAVTAGTSYAFEVTDFSGAGGTLRFAVTEQVGTTTSTTRTTTTTLTSTTSTTAVSSTTTTSTNTLPTTTSTSPGTASTTTSTTVPSPPAWTDRPVSGLRLTLKRSPSGREMAVFVSTDAFALFPAPGGADDPRATGATVDLFSANPDEGMGSFVLPAGQWALNDAATAYKFVNRMAPDATSSVKVAIIKQGRLLKFKAKAAGLPLSTAEGAVGVRVRTGNLRSCARFGGAVARDEAGRFMAKNAAATGLADCSDASLRGAASAP